MNISHGLFSFMDMKNKPDILSVLEKLGIELKQRGRHLWACCPLHQERTPSFCVDNEKQRWRCFGACGEGGDVINFVMKYHGISFKEALSHLGINGNENQVDSAEVIRRERVKKFRQWCSSYLKVCCEMLRLCNQIDALVQSPENLEHKGMEKVYFQRDVYKYHLDILQGAEDRAKLEIFKEVMGL